MNIYIPTWIFLLLPSVAMLYTANGITNGFSYGWPFAQVKTESLTAKGSSRSILARLAFIMLAFAMYVALGWIWYRWVGVFQGVAAWLLGIAFLVGDVERFMRGTPVSSVGNLEK